MTTFTDFILRPNLLMRFIYHWLFLKTILFYSYLPETVSHLLCSIPSLNGGKDRDLFAGKHRNERTSKSYFVVRM